MSLFFRYLAEKRNPWIFRGYYHPAWYKRNQDEHAAASNKVTIIKYINIPIIHIFFSNSTSPNNHQLFICCTEFFSICLLSANSEVQVITPPYDYLVIRFRPNMVLPFMCSDG